MAVVDSTVGDVVQLVRKLPCRWLESYTVTANSLPRFKRLRAHAYISRIYRIYKDASLLPRNARFPAKCFGRCLLADGSKSAEEDIVDVL